MFSITRINVYDTKMHMKVMIKITESNRNNIIN